jgi:hypothetical protein
MLGAVGVAHIRFFFFFLKGLSFERKLALLGGKSENGRPLLFRK